MMKYFFAFFQNAKIGSLASPPQRSESRFPDNETTGKVR